MLKKLDLEELFEEENGKIDDGQGIGGVGLITPNQFIKVFNYKKKDYYGNEIEGLGSHIGTVMMILKEIYDLNVPDNKNGFPDMSQVNKNIINGEKNFIYIYYISQSRGNHIVVQSPKYITPYEYDKIIEFYEEVKDFDIPVEVLVSNYNPINRTEIGEEKYFTLDNSISEYLNYMKNNNRVVDYKLPFKEEKKFNNNQKTI